MQHARERVLGCAALLLIALYLFSVRRASWNSAQPPAKRAASSGECSAAYEACGAVPAPVGRSPCCDPDFFCFKVPPYFSQCRPRCAPLLGACDNVVPCCAGAVCSADGRCVPRRAAWYATRGKSPRFLRPLQVTDGDERVTARAVFRHFEQALQSVPRPKALVARIPPEFEAWRRVALRNRVAHVMRNPAMEVVATEGSLKVSRRGWRLAEIREAGMVLAAFEEVVEVRPMA